MNVVVASIQLALAALFVVAATGKILRAEDFDAALRLSGAPDRSVPTVRRLVPAVEITLALALALTTGTAAVAALLATLALLVVFTVWLVRVRALGLKIRCGCFGAGKAEVGTRTVVRNAALIALAAAGVAFALSTPSALPGPALETFMAATSAAAALALLVALWSVRDRLALTMRGLNRIMQSGSR